MSGPTDDSGRGDLRSRADSVRLVDHFYDRVRTSELTGSGNGLRSGAHLEAVRVELEDARLAKEDTLGRNVTEAERQHFRRHRPDAAAHWNLLTTLRAEDLRYGH